MLRQEWALRGAGEGAQLWPSWPLLASSHWGGRPLMEAQGRGSGSGPDAVTWGKSHHPSSLRFLVCVGSKDTYPTGGQRGAVSGVSQSQT